jgi:hypothetical protein
MLTTTYVNKTFDTPTGGIYNVKSMSEKALDKSPRIVLAKPDMETVKRARRWLRGAAMLLADASNGDPLIERLAGEASIVALLAEVAILEYEDPAQQPSA